MTDLISHDRFISHNRFVSFTAFKVYPFSRLLTLPLKKVS
jgi:hypothetical protein